MLPENRLAVGVLGSDGLAAAELAEPDLVADGPEAAELGEDDIAGPALVADGLAAVFAAVADIQLADTHFGIALKQGY